MLEDLKGLEKNALAKLSSFQKERNEAAEKFYEGYLTALLHIKGVMRNENKKT